LPRYTSQGIVYRLFVHAAAQRDLDAIGETDPETADEIYVLLQEIKGSQVLLDSLTRKDFGLTREEAFHVDRWVRQQQQGRNLWRLKFWDLEAVGIRHRVIYALDPRNSRYYILAVLPRNIAYDERHPRVQELLAVYDRLGIPSYR